MARLAFFCFDISEASQIRRIVSLQSLGHVVQSFSFRRSNMNEGFRPNWPNVDLGATENGNFTKRLFCLGNGLIRAMRGRKALAGSEIWIARNLDLLVIAWAMRLLTGQRNAVLVYECLDIHGLMTGKGVAGALLRWIERRLLKRIRLLIISSPSFDRAYFKPMQGYDGPVALIENKLWLGDTPLTRPTIPRQPGAPLVLGWVGSLRCRNSLAILGETARRMGDALLIECHGNVHAHAVPEFHEIVAAHPNIRYHGTYDYPEGLGGIYRGCDLVWAQDLWQSGTNSDWLLPNRIYEAGYFGCPSIALARTETGKCIIERGLGFTIEDATAEALAMLLGSLNREVIRDASAALLHLPESAFRLEPAELAETLAPLLSRPGRSEVAKPASARIARDANSIRLR